MHEINPGHLYGPGFFVGFRNALPAVAAGVQLVPGIADGSPVVRQSIYKLHL